MGYSYTSVGKIILATRYTQKSPLSPGQIYILRKPLLLAACQNKFEPHIIAVLNKPSFILFQRWQARPGKKTTPPKLQGGEGKAHPYP